MLRIIQTQIFLQFVHDYLQCFLQTTFAIQTLKIFAMFQWIQHNNPAFKLKILDYTYTSEPSINSALPMKKSNIKLIFFVLGVILSSGFLWLLSKWSKKRKAVFLYNVCQWEQATHFLIEEEDVISGSTIVERIDKMDIRDRSMCASFTYHERTYLFHRQKQVFLPIRYEQLGIHLDQLKKNIFQPYSKSLRPQLSDYYGPNIINLPIQTKLQVFIQEMLTPYEVFQTYAIILWITEQYYIFSFILLFYALYTYWESSSQVTSNQEKLSKQSYFQLQCKILVNQNDNIGAINLNDQAQLEQVTDVNNKVRLEKSASIKQRNNKHQMVQQDVQPQIELVSVKKTNSEYLDSSRRKSVIDKHLVKVMQVNSKELLPGDLLILHEGDTIPCDCILLRGQILINEGYITGQNYLIRKKQLQNFTYSKQNQKSFTLYLGTTVAKIKSKSNVKESYVKNSLQQSIACDELTMPNQIVCLVINTNYNTLRGKYLRAIRYQKKQQQTFTLQTIYFIYILIAFTTLVYFSLFSLLNQGNVTKLDLFIMYLDMISTSIPPTLPTLLSVGINFARKRLKHYNIHCVLPSNILTGGRVDTIVLQGHHAFGKQYQIQSMLIGVKNGRSFGQTFTSVQKFYNYYQEDLDKSSNSLEEINKKKIQKKSAFQNGELFLNALATCHGLEYYEDKIQGSLIQKKVFQFSEGQAIKDDNFKTKDCNLTVQKRIYFKQKDQKIAVVVNIQKPNFTIPAKQQQISQKVQLFSLLDQDNQGQLSKKLKSVQQIKSQQIPNTKPTNQKVIFIKGPPQKILRYCRENSFPKNTGQYVVDMAEKGFNLTCYASLKIDQTTTSTTQCLAQINKNKMNFLGFLVFRQLRYQDNLQAIKAFKKADIKVLLVSQQRQLESSSVAILNNICEKKQLLLCSYLKNRNKINIKGHTEWQSTSQDPFPELMSEFGDIAQNSLLSLTSPLYQQLFMRRETDKTDVIFQKSVIFNKMEHKHERNIYTQLDKRNKTSFAVGGGGIVSECANLSMELQRDQSSLLSSFHTKSKSLMTIFHCLRICRAGLSTNFHVFSMMILFSLIQYTTVTMLQANYQYLTNSQMLYQDLFITFPIFITLNMTKASSKLSKQRPLTSFFDKKALVSMLGQLVLQFIAQLSFILYLLTFQELQQQKESAYKFYLKSGSFVDKSVMTVSTFVLSNYLYLGVVLSTSVSKPFRKPFYTNPWYTLILILLWLYNTLIVFMPSFASDQIRKQNISDDEEFIVILALIYGNLMMVLMYLYENFLVWVWDMCKNWKKNRNLDSTIIVVQEMKDVRSFQQRQY